ncbi:hypothetical protein GNI_086440 [Gregarina niphandrodes]|uniref:KHDC4/BBP-like KH-domain type I domain-containing protein n=1 Tax=Gregarina niphandrodes TaxID=110365 RepID=A0A023B5W9_GRENI|nr:hypothetical protein GNI_086440 [Gregarina niphandrodes]EZG63618.1 hypothetical protein GNI_086440 [Gregarina niphandrodes]|eukprot:XP_011130658.1 hypothetical protein GNI_086440 [Gregarina niphandrodes]
MHPPAKSRGGIGNNPRSREDRPWKYIERIPIDESRFPPNVKPAAIIIGVRGTNHARLQDESGCCVQLRGKGISSPGTPGAEEPMHLWVKYDTPDQLEKVRAVLEEIVKSCVPNKAAVTRPVTVAVRTQWPDVLPPKPSAPPVKPLDCFYTIHYFVHAVPNVTTANFETTYEHFFGFPLEAKFAELGKGSVVQSLLVIPKVVRLEHTGTGVIPLSPQELQPSAVYYVRPVLPKGIPVAGFHQHVSQKVGPPLLAAAPAVVAAVAPASAASAAAPVEFAELFGKALNPQSQASPQELLVQGIHGILVRHFLRTVRHLAASDDESLLPDLAQKWPGVPLNLVADAFRQMGVDLFAARFGRPSVVRLLHETACPEILDLEWVVAPPPAGHLLHLRFGRAGLHPDFSPLTPTPSR